ncbi:uncharacterized protein Dvir_GJ26444 [Drosophila virilis]|uniref:Uncharacterized protein n=1 Tax=Drosophila virilis TaxID=7244 RepID=A0A0Q9W8D8_DROVI|nr:uncharacterized protein Dvir_GJ26444 [Drosophila virilis]
MSSHIYLYLWVLLIAMVHAKQNFHLILDSPIVENLAPDLVDEIEFRVSQLNNRSYVSTNLRLKQFKLQPD